MQGNLVVLAKDVFPLAEDRSMSSEGLSYSLDSVSFQGCLRPYTGQVCTIRVFQHSIVSVRVIR